MKKIITLLLLGALFTLEISQVSATTIEQQTSQNLIQSGYAGLEGGGGGGTGGIPTKVLNSARTAVNIGAFDARISGGGGVAYRNAKTGWKISKDTAGHGGRQWKLFSNTNKRVASLDADGKILNWYK